MHEVSLVADLIEICEQRVPDRPIARIRIRHATTIPAASLEQAFRMLTEGGRLAEAVLETQPFDIELACPCGFAAALGHDDVIGGSLAICPACGDPSPLHRTAEIELLEVVAAAG